MDLLSISVGIGLVVSLVFSEFFGIAGGLVVPGYFALQLRNPFSILLTLGIALCALLFAKCISRFTILYGKRRTALLLLSGFLLDALCNEWILNGLRPVLPISKDIQAVGHIIPGLIALWMDRQGWMETVASLLTASVIVRLILILFLGSEFSEL